MNLKLLGYTFLYFCIFFTSCSSKNIDTETSLQARSPCNCEQAFLELVQKLESNYIALALLRDTDAYQAYESRKEAFAAKSISQPESLCASFLSQFLSHFNDEHLFAWNLPQYDEAFLQQRKMFFSKEKLSREEIDLLLTDRSDPIIGKWSDGESVFAIVRMDSSFKGFLIKSNRKDVEMGSLKIILKKETHEYSGSYIAYNYSDRFVRAGIYRKGERLKLIMGGPLSWLRAEDEIMQAFTKAPSIQQINEVHTLLTIPSFSYNGKDFKSFLKENRKLINNTRHLIIDIRANTGGNSIYFPLIEYFATKTLKSRPGYVLSSPDNRTYFQKYIGFAYSKIYSPLLERMTETGEIVEGPSYPDKDFKKTKNKIERVSIITDKGCKSASESFILHARGASDKVMTFGSPTGGVIDYTSVNILLLKNSGRQNIYFGYPTGTLHQDVLENGYNKTGIIPDVSLPENQDWVQAAIDSFDRK